MSISPLNETSHLRVLPSVIVGPGVDERAAAAAVMRLSDGQLHADDSDPVGIGSTLPSGALVHLGVGIWTG